MHILPKNVFNGVNSNGTTFTMREWDFKTLANLQGLAFFISLFIIFLSCSIIAPLLLILCLVQLDKRVIANNIVGIVVGSYFLFDCYHDWLSIRALAIFCDASQITFMIALNVACLVTHISILFVGSLPKLSKSLGVSVLIGVFLIALIGGFNKAPKIGKLRFDALAKREIVKDVDD